MRFKFEVQVQKWFIKWLVSGGLLTLLINAFS